MQTLDLSAGRASERIEALREVALDRSRGIGQVSCEAPLLAAEGWRTAEGLPRSLRAAHAIANVLRKATPEIDPDHELLVGSVHRRHCTEQEQAEAEAATRYLSEEHPVPGITAHMAFDSDQLLALGVEGIRQKALERQAALDPDDPASTEKREFYDGAILVLDALIRHAEAYVRRAEALAAASRTPQRKQELLEIAEVLRRVPRHPARTFREALQSHWFVFYAVSYEVGGYVCGRPDRSLLPYYESDRRAGRLGATDALELLCCYYILINHLNGTWPTAMLVGGQDENGRDITSELSYLLLDAMAATRLVNPSIAISWHRGTPDALLQRGAELIRQGFARPAIFNDAVIVPGLERLGCSRREAVNYIHSSCVEITPIGCSNVWVASPYVNLLKPLEYVLNRGKSIWGPDQYPGLDLGPAERLDSFEQFFAAYQRQLAEAIKHTVAEQSALREDRRAHHTFPLISCFVNDCIERGCDIERGGARHEWIEPSHVGLANAANSLGVIRSAVFQERRMTLTQLSDMLAADFPDDRARQALVATAPKYGNDLDAADDLVRQITESIFAAYEEHRGPGGVQFEPGFFTWIMHNKLGKETAASPDGRRHGEVLADGPCAQQGTDRRGLTALVNSVTKWDHGRALGGVAINMKLTEQALEGDAGLAALVALIKTFLAKSGFEVQVNVASRETLRDAQRHPELYRDLVVRVAGYSEYFTLLPSALQDDVISRTEHRVS